MAEFTAFIFALLIIFITAMFLCFYNLEVLAWDCTKYSYEHQECVRYEAKPEYLNK